MQSTFCLVLCLFVCAGGGWVGWGGGGVNKAVYSPHFVLSCVCVVGVVVVVGWGWG